METKAKWKLVNNLIRGYAPPGINYVQHALILTPRGEELLMRVVMKNEEEIFCWIDAYDNIRLIDPWDWLSKGGLFILARQKGIGN
jgi:hypothetical protein